MGTGFFSGIFALIGIYKYWGDSQLGGFILLVIVSWFVTEMVRGDVEKNGIDGANKLLSLSAMVLQIAIIVIGFSSLWS